MTRRQMVRATRMRCLVALLVTALAGGSGCYRWQAIDNPRTATRQMSRIRITTADSARREVVRPRFTAQGIGTNGTAHVVPWDSVSRVQERRLSIWRTALVGMGAVVVGAAIPAFIISGPEAIGLGGGK